MKPIVEKITLIEQIVKRIESDSVNRIIISCDKA